MIREMIAGTGDNPKKHINNKTDTHTRTYTRARVRACVKFYFIIYTPFGLSL